MFNDIICYTGIIVVSIEEEIPQYNDYKIYHKNYI